MLVWTHSDDLVGLTMTSQFFNRRMTKSVFWSHLEAEVGTTTATTAATTRAMSSTATTATATATTKTRTMSR